MAGLIDCALGGKGGAAASYAPTKVKSAACQQVIRLGSDINLLELPLPTFGQKKTPIIHSAVMLSAEPETHTQVFLRGDVQVSAGNTADVDALWSDEADWFRLRKAYRDLGGRMPLAVVIGGEPTVQFATGAPLPSAIDPFGLIGLCGEKPIDAVSCRSVDLLVPAESDFIIEGWIDPAEKISVPAALPRPSLKSRLNLTAVTHRANRICSQMTCDIDRNECCVESSVLNRVVARLFLPYLQTRIPELVDFDLPLSGGSAIWRSWRLIRHMPGSRVMPPCKRGERSHSSWHLCWFSLTPRPVSVILNRSSQLSLPIYVTRSSIKDVGNCTERATISARQRDAWSLTRRDARSRSSRLRPKTLLPSVGPSTASDRRPRHE